MEGPNSSPFEEKRWGRDCIRSGNPRKGGTTETTPEEKKRRRGKSQVIVLRDGGRTKKRNRYKDRKRYVQGSTTHRKRKKSVWGGCGPGFV